MGKNQLGDLILKYHSGLAAKEKIVAYLYLGFPLQGYEVSSAN